MLLGCGVHGCCKWNWWTRVFAWCIWEAGSHEFSELGYPFHLIRYWIPFLLGDGLDWRIVSTLWWSSSPSMMSSGGLVKLGPWAVVSLYGETRDLWNTGCMHQFLGNWSLQLIPQVDNTLKGPCHWGASLAFGWVVWTLVPSSQTRSLGLNLCVSMETWGRFMTLAATFSAAVTLDLICSRMWRHSSTVGSW